ncbi:MAG: hypothetical protein QW343_03175 [Candidatus Norongarragalinales archaeon]
MVWLASLATADAVEPNSCVVEGVVVSIEAVSPTLSRVVFETTLARNNSAVPCFFHAKERVTASFEHLPLDCVSSDCVGRVIDLREGDVFSGELSVQGEEWNQTTFLSRVSIKNPECAPLEGCGLDCGAVGFAKNSRGCFECKCAKCCAAENFFRFSFATGWNYYSYPLAVERFAFCLPGKECLQEKSFLPKIIATDCNSESVLWRWTDGGKTYSEFQFPDVGKKESVSFAGELLVGYWFKAKTPCSVTIVGEEVSASRLEGKQLFKGWNSIGSPSVSTTFDSVKGDCIVEKGPYGWDAATQKFVKTTQLEPGKAVFVKVKRDCWLSVSR